MSAQSAVRMCSPRYATRRRPDRPTLGPAVARAAELIGKPFMPHQQAIADVAFELDPRTGRLAYREVIVTIPRQNGKTTLLESVTLQRALGTKHYGGRQRIVYTAQTRKDARKKWEEDFLEDFAQAPALRGKYRVRLQSGSEHVRFSNGSRFGVDATSEKSGHGPTIDLGHIDEAFAQQDARTELAFKPAMITRAEPQMWVASTAGWEGASPYLWGKVKRGRELAAAGDTDGVAYFEWSFPQGCDPLDPRVWWENIPALGITITEEALATDAKSMGVNEFSRSYGNLWLPKDVTLEWQVISREQWAKCLNRDSAPLGPVSLAVDISQVRDRGSIAACGYVPTGVHYEVVDDRPGTSWMGERIDDLAHRWDPVCVLIDGRSQAMSLKPELERRGIEVVVTGARDMATACALTFDDVTQGAARHLGQPELAEALASAVKRPIGDAWAWSRKGDGSITALVAASLARLGLTRYKPPAPAPVLADAANLSTRSETSELARAGF